MKNKPKIEVKERNIVDMRTREPWVHLKFEDEPEPEDNSALEIPLWVLLLIVFYLLT